MALVLEDRVKETTTSTGVGAVTLAGAPTGFQPFSVIGDGNTTYYCIVDTVAGDWETGLGTYTLSGTSLARTTVLSSSNAGAAVSFAAGSKDVFVTFPAGRAEYTDRVAIAGFPVDSSGNYLCTLTYNETTRTVTVTPTGSSFEVFAGGTKFTKIGAQSVVHPATGTDHFIYYDITGTLVASTTPWDLLKDAPVCFVFQDVTNGRRLPFEERHHSGRDLYWHRNQHFAEGTKATGSGFQVTGYTLDTSGDAANTFGISSGRLEDEDIRVDTEALPDAGPYFSMRRDGASGAWVLERTNIVPFFRSGTNIQYNQNTGATWQLTGLSNSEYVNYYIFGVTALPQASITPSPGAVQQFVVVPGQKVFGTSALASADTVASIAWGTMPFQEIVPLYRLTFSYAAAGGGTVKLVEIIRVIGTSASVSAASQTDHGALTGLSDQDHPASAIIVTPAGGIAATDVQAALEELDTQLSGLGGLLYSKKTANYTAVHNDYIYADVSSGSFTITLPATPSANDVVYIADYAGLFGTANITVARNGSTIEGAATDATLSFPNKEYTFVYIDTSWQIFTKDAQVGVTSQIYFTGPTTGNEGTDIILEIVGWSVSSIYTPSVSGGTAVQTTSSLRWTLPSVTTDTVHTLTLSIAGGGSYTHTVNVINVSTSVDTSISVTDFSIKDSSVGWTI